MATGVLISSFFYAGPPVVNAIFGGFKASSSVQIQRLQISAQTVPVGGSITVAIINQSGVELGRVILYSGSSGFQDTALTSPITLAMGTTIRAKILSVDLGTAQNITLNLIGATASGSNAPGSCGPGPLECQPPSAQMLFFPGTAGPAGPQGAASTVAGPVGPTGPAGAFSPYAGDYVSTTVYYDTALRKDIVSYAGSFWQVNNPGKSGFNSWEAPNVTDWTDIGSTLINVATGWKLLAAQTIPVGVTVVSPGFIQSNNFVTNTSGWVLTAAGALQSFDTVMNGLVSTNTPKFNLADVTRTMPTIGYASYDIPAILDADIPVFGDYVYATSDDLIFFGWLAGAVGYLENRFGNAAQKFQVAVSGTGTNTSASADILYIGLFYRTRVSSGAWGSWTAATGQLAHVQDLAVLVQSFANRSSLSVTLAGNQDIQFAAGFSKSAAATAAVSGATLSVLAFN